MNDDRWPDELDAGDPRLADVMRADPSVEVYSAPSPIRCDALVSCHLDWEPVRFGFWRALLLVLLVDGLGVGCFEAWRVIPWLH